MITWIRTPTFANSSEEETSLHDFLAKEEANQQARRDSGGPSHQPSRIQRIRRSLINPYLQKRAKYDLRQTIVEPDFDLVHFLAGGQRLSCPDSILSRYPNSTLGDPSRIAKYYCIAQDVHNFSTTLSDVFEAVLEFYEGGALVRPERLTVDYFLEQLEVFELESVIITRYLRQEGVKLPKSPYNPATRKDVPGLERIWEFFRYPELTLASRVFNFVSLIFTCTSITIYILETVPELSAVLGETGSLGQALQNPYFIVNNICYLFFAVELLLRFISCPSKIYFFKRWYHWIDLLSIITHIVLLGVIGSGVHPVGQPHFAREVGVIRAVRLFRILKPIGASKTVGSPSQYWIGILWQTVRNNASTLSVLLFLLLLCMVLFAGVAYAIEGGPNNAIPTIPHGFWWAIITMTTVGYGDMYPMYAAGQVVAIVCGSVGLIFIAFLLHSVSIGYQRLMKTNAEYRRYLTRRKVRAAALESKSDSAVVVSTASSHSEARDTEAMIDLTVMINGAEFILKCSDLALYPESLLSNAEKRRQYYLKDSTTMYLSRSASVFPSIVSFYTAAGYLRRPPFVPMRKFVQELVFYELGEKALVDLFAAEGIALVKEVEPKNPILLFWYRVWEHPEFNLLSRVIGIVSILVITLSVVTLILETIPQMLSPECVVTQSNGTNSSLGAAKKLFNHVDCPAETTFFILESVCTAWYVLELFSRFAVAPVKLVFLKTVMNWVDALTIFPYIFTLVEYFSDSPASHMVINSFGFLRTIRLVRLIALFKYSRFSKTMQMILTILKSAWFELSMSCYFSFVMAIIFGTLAYLSEESPSQIDSIPRGMYWAWVTMLTIGYGDIVPKSVFGYLTGGVCAIAGTVFWSLPMTLVADHYAKYRLLYNDQEFMIAVLERLERAHKKREGTDNGGASLAQALDLSKVEDITKPPADLLSGFTSLPPVHTEVDRPSMSEDRLTHDDVELSVLAAPRSRSFMDLTLTPVRNGKSLPVTPVPSLKVEGRSKILNDRV